MESSKNDLFVILLRLKSYLVSMIDSPDSSPENLYFTEEYLQNKFPEIKDELISILKKHDIKSDKDIAFNNSVHLQFKEIVEGSSVSVGLTEILKKYAIASDAFSTLETYLDGYRLMRDKKIKDLVDVLLKLARSWANMKNLQSEIDDLSELSEEEVLRPEEEDTFLILDETSTKALNELNRLSKIYLEGLSDYLYKYGGDVQLKNFAEFIKELEVRINKNYNDLLKRASPE